jgi:hypothetical protein
MTHTYAILAVSKAAFEEIRDKLLDAGYAGQVHDDGDAPVIDMHGIGLRAEED